MNQSKNTIKNWLQVQNRNSKKMAKTVGSAFTEFRTYIVDLDLDETKKVRVSRDYLLEQLNNLARQLPDFPKINNNIGFGSFARRTKIRPLDDIDLMILLDKKGTTAECFLFKQNTYSLKITDRESPLKIFADENGHINSIKLVNKFVSSLGQIPSYRNAEINRNKQAAVLNLTSYNWSFDIVPAFEIYDFWNKNVSCYIIPDGKGNWMKTDPREDSSRVFARNEKHNKMFLPTLRLLKYWNNLDYNKKKLDSYYFEILVSKVFGNRTPQIKTLPEAIGYFFKNCPSYLMNSCPDPNGFGRALDSELEPKIRKEVKDEMLDALSLYDKALSYEKRQRQREAILLWHIIFGQKFPVYS